MSEGKPHTYKVVITKAMSQDEQLQCELSADTKGGLRERLADALDILDARLNEQGQRVVDATQWVQKFPPEVRMAVNAIIGTLYGRPGAIQEVHTAAAAIEQMGKTAKEDAAIAKDADGIPRFEGKR